MSTFDFDVTCKVNLTFTIDLTDYDVVEAVNAYIEDETEHIKADDNIDEECFTLSDDQIEGIRQYITSQCEDNADETITDICAVWGVEVGNEPI